MREAKCHAAFTSGVEWRVGGSPTAGAEPAHRLEGRALSRPKDDTEVVPPEKL